MHLILGSQSPRRRELLAGLDVDFTVVTIDADETYPDHLQGGDISLYIACAKAHAYANHLRPDEVLLTSDTIVWCADSMLGKPKDRADAVRMLHLLSGRTHQVFTGVCLMSPAPEFENRSFVVRTDVTFRQLTDAEIDYYVDTYQPFDKAGAYGIQEWIGYVACERLEGSYFNVMGLPTETLYPHLCELNIK